MSFVQMPHTPTSVWVDGEPVILSGFVLVNRASVITLRASNIEYEIAFRDDPDSPEHGVETEQITETKLRIVLKNFSNALGTGLGPVQVGQLANRPITLSVFVMSLGAELRATHYSLAVAK